MTVRGRDEDITMSSFSLYYTWRNDLRLYNSMIFVIMILIITTPLDFDLPHSTSRRAQVTLIQSSSAAVLAASSDRLRPHGSVQVLTLI